MSASPSSSAAPAASAASSSSVPAAPPSLERVNVAQLDDGVDGGAAVVAASPFSLAAALGDASSGGEAKRKHGSDDESFENDGVAPKEGAAASAKKQKVVGPQGPMPTGVAVVVCAMINATLHVLGFQEDRHEWPEGVREKWDAEFLRNPDNRGAFPNSPFQLYTDVPEEGLRMPGKLFEDGQSQQWSRHECLRLMLTHMLGKGWCPKCVTQTDDDAAELSFADYVKPFKDRERLLQRSEKSWQEHLCDGLGEAEWRAFSELIKANQPQKSWHFITIPAENCKGKDMSTMASRKAEMRRALDEEGGLVFSDDDELDAVAKVTDGKYKTSVHGLMVVSDQEVLRMSRDTLAQRQVEFPWRCPHNWPGVRGRAFKNKFETLVKAFRETKEPRWVPEKKIASVFDAKSQAQIATVFDDIKKSVCSV